MDLYEVIDMDDDEGVYIARRWEGVDGIEDKTRDVARIPLELAEAGIGDVLEVSGEQDSYEAAEIEREATEAISEILEQAREDVGVIDRANYLFSPRRPDIPFHPRRLRQINIVLPEGTNYVGGSGYETVKAAYVSKVSGRHVTLHQWAQSHLAPPEPKEGRIAGPIHLSESDLSNVTDATRFERGMAFIPLRGENGEIIGLKHDPEETERVQNENPTLWIETENDEYESPVVAKLMAIEEGMAKFRLCDGQESKYDSRDFRVIGPASAPAHYVPPGVGTGMYFELLDEYEPKSNDVRIDLGNPMDNPPL